MTVFRIRNQTTGQIEERVDCDRCDCLAEPVSACYHGCWPEYHNQHTHTLNMSSVVSPVTSSHDTSSRDTHSAGELPHDTLSADNMSSDKASHGVEKTDTKTAESQSNAALPHPISELRAVNDQ